MSAKKTQVLLVCGALILFVLLFIAPKTAQQEKPVESNATSRVTADNNANLQVYENMAVKSLGPEQKKATDRWSAGKMHDSLIAFWDNRKRPDLASVYAEQKAAAANKAALWFEAGNRYYNAVQFTEDKTETPLLYQCAIRAFSRGLNLEPGNTDARIMLASCYVEGTADPMQGISMLREVEKTDSNNVKLQLAFAFFSVKSGQLDRAIHRFNKALRADSNYIEAYLHLADAYEQQGNTVKTIEMLEQYGKRTGDPTAKAEINKYIEQLKR